MDRQQLIEKTRNVTDRQSLLDLLNDIKAQLLGDASYPFTMRKMLVLCNPKREGSKHSQRYRMFTIPKKTGGLREIYAPCGNLKWMQICLNEIFKAIYTPSHYAMGFTEGKCIVDNARVHTNQNYVFNIDLSDFFPSIDQARVWKRLQLAPFNFNKSVANIIAGLCSIKSMRINRTGELSECYNLPQGAPTSPILTNAICDTLDRRLSGLAKRFGLHYSRYADDISFSSMHNVYQEGSEFRKELERIITCQNFRINPKKTRLHHRSIHQEVTGLTVGDKINVPKKYVKDLRAILHIWERYGKKAAIAAFYPRYKSDKGYLHHGEPNIENVISGKLCYLKMVKGNNDPVYSKLTAQFHRLTTNKPDTPCERTWEYILTESIPDFEKRLGVKIEYAVSKNGKQYGYFELNNDRVIVSISQNISINQIPDNAQISFCIRTDFRPIIDSKIYITQKASPEDVQAINRIKLDCPLPDDLTERYYILIHRPLKDGTQRRIVLSDNGNDEFKKSITEFAKKIPELRLINDNPATINSTDNTDTLSRLVESGFDLSILP